MITTDSEIRKARGSYSGFFLFEGKWHILIELIKARTRNHCWLKVCRFDIRMPCEPPITESAAKAN